MAEELPPQLQDKIMQFQQLQQQIQLITNQKVQLESQARDNEKAISELGKATDDTPIYKSVGSLFVRAEDKVSVENELNERKETLDIRIKAIDRQEKQLMEKYQALQQDLSQAISASRQPSG